MATQADVVLSVTPSPIAATPCTPAICDESYFDFHAAWTLRIAERAGIGGSVASMTLTLREETRSGIIFVIYVSDRDVTRGAGTNRVSAGGSLSVPYASGYNGSGSPRATLTIEVRFVDDRGNVLDRSVVVPVR